MNDLPQSGQPEVNRSWGPVVALSFVSLWGVSLAMLLCVLPDEWVLSWVTPALSLWMTLLYTGLFITAHDAMHGTVWPGNRRANDWMGRIAVGLYALFPYRQMVLEHRRHHQHPASLSDPDWHDGQHDSLWRWYLNFVLHYVTWKQVVGMALVFNVLSHVAGIAESRLLLFWVVPSLLSTMQLFYFGTWLPHREAAPAFVDEHRAHSNAWPVWLSFLTCYHFGYHWEHHRFPSVPWWHLPAVRQATLALSGAQHVSHGDNVFLSESVRESGAVSSSNPSLSNSN